MQLFGTTGQKFLHCPGTKGKRDKVKILPRDRTGRDSQNSGRDGPGQPKSGTVRGTEEFVPEHLLLPLSRDTGTRFFLSWDKGTKGNPNLNLILCQCMIHSGSALNN